MGVSLAGTDVVLDLTAEVERVLWDFDALRTADRPIRVQVGSDGRVILRGPARSRFVRDQILELVRAVPGVAEVIDHIIADPELEVRVAEALALAPRTASLTPGSVLVHCRYGAVILTGQLPPGTDREAVVQVARGVPGVVQVDDRLT
ncbi:MAG: BON domain-containing protein [Anaerolineales bacterium]